MVTFLIISLAIFAFKVRRTETLGMLREPDDLFLKVGEGGILHCVLEQPPLSPCYWSKDGYTVRIEDRYEYIGNASMGDCSIRIKKSDYKMDNGIWKCGTLTTSSARGMRSRNVKVTIIVMPNDPVITINGVRINDSNIYINHLQNQPSVICKSDYGNPGTTLSWRLNDRYLGDNTHYKAIFKNSSWLELHLTIDVTWHRQRLSCIADHPAYGVNQQRTTSVTFWIKHKPANVGILMERNGEIVNDKVIGAATAIKLHCITDTGYPPPRFSWQWRNDESELWETLFQGQNLTIVSRPGQYSCLTRDINNEVIRRSSDFITVQDTNVPSRIAVYIIFFGVTGGLLFASVVGSAILINKRKAISSSNEYMADALKKTLPQLKLGFDRSITTTGSDLDVSQQLKYNYDVEADYLAPISLSEVIQTTNPEDLPVITNSAIPVFTFMATDERDQEPIYHEIIGTRESIYK